VRGNVRLVQALEDRSLAKAVVVAGRVR